MIRRYEDAPTNIAGVRIIPVVEQFLEVGENWGWGAKSVVAVVLVIDGARVTVVLDPPERAFDATGRDL